MPSPIGHALGGLIVALAFGGRGSPAGSEVADRAEARVLSGERRRARELLAVCTAVACLPDIDFLWGRHNLETHSLGFALLVGIAIYAWKRSAPLAIAATLAVATHVLFDWLGSDDSPPIGVMALWPFSSGYYFADAFLFDAISRRYWLAGFIQHNVLAVLKEIAILGPVAAVLWWRRRR